MNIDDIKGLVNKDELLKQIEINDDYGSACVNVAINVMRHLDNFEGEFNIGYHPDMTTPHGIICECDDQGGISGYMAGVARNIVTRCYKDGWKFFLADVVNRYNMDNPESINNPIESLVEANLVSKEDAEAYVKELAARYKNK